MWMRGILFASSVTGAVSWPSLPTPTCPSADTSRGKSPFDTFVGHFSLDTVGTDVFLHTRLAEIYANSSLTVTQSYYFNPFMYAAEQPEKLISRELDNVQTIKRIVYSPARRRRDGDGLIGESTSFAGYRLAFGNEEVEAVSATWTQGFSTITQWHLIGNKATAERSIHEVSAYCSSIRNAILVYDQSMWYPDQGLWESVQKASWEDVISDEDFKGRSTSDYRSFFKSEKTYKDLAVPWKRGLIFLGPPGNGKTISSKAIMKDVKVPSLYVKSFHSWSGDQAGIKQIFERARAEAPCVLVLEDLDSSVNDDNRSFFLNEVDGSEDNDGLLSIGTTNHFDRLDPASSSRPSRFDRKYTFTDPKRKERREYAVYWQNKLKSNKGIKFPDESLDKVADQTNKFSFAYLKEAFVSTLLTSAGRDDGPGEGGDFEHVLLDQIKRSREQSDEDDSVKSSVAQSQPHGGTLSGHGGLAGEMSADPRGGNELAGLSGSMGKDRKSDGQWSRIEAAQAYSGIVANGEEGMGQGGFEPW